MTEADRFAGCLVGQALGDALGFVVEGQSPAVCAAYVEHAVRPFRLEEYRRGRFPLGQYSDDTQLARELMSSFLECRGFEAPNYAGRIAALFTEDRIVGRGIATEEAALRLARGTSWEEAGAPPPAAGNGSAMRAAPAGLLFARDADALIRVAHDQGRITHQDRRCSAGAIAIAGATAMMATLQGGDHGKLCKTLAEWTFAYDPILSNAIEQLPDWADETPERAVTRIARIGLDPSYRDGWEGISPFVTPSVLWSLYSVLHSPGDYWQAICTAIAVGGDVDTTAAMTGAMAGAAVGLNGIPDEPSRLVTDRGHWGYDALVGLAREVHVLHSMAGKGVLATRDDGAD